MTPSSVAGPTGPSWARLGPVDVLLLSVWCGLAGGWLEVGTRILVKTLIGTNRLYMMSRHFVWLVPLSDLLLFSGVGLLLAAFAKLAPRRGGWLGPRVLCAMAILPALMIAGPQIYAWAWLILAWGIAIRLVPRMERSAIRARRWLIWSIPGLLGLVAVVAGFVFGGERFEQWREARRPLPPGDAPDVLLVVLDTVRADRLSLYGYPRPTSRTLESLARRGIRFDEARATAPWTLPSHATMFTGRWPSELDVQWATPLRDRFTTLAEYLSSHGYATAGFVANTEYCSYDTRLDRGFTHYEDYGLDLPHLRPLRMALLIRHAWDGASNLGTWLTRTVPASGLLSGLRWLVATDRKDAGAVNREFLEWLSDRPEPRRPFFVFLNYFDAHSPYLPPNGAGFRFGMRPRTPADLVALFELWGTTDKLSLPSPYHQLLRDSYDNCLAYLDDRLGELFDTLRRRGVLERTVVIITADHGEELGEHRLFEHGESLYRPEIRVPLLIVMPSGPQSPKVVRETVSLRDLPATIVDLVGLAAGAPFPGRSLARFWRDLPPGATSPAICNDEGAISELTGANPANPNPGRSPAARGPLISLAEGDYVYIRHQRDGREQLFDERADPGETISRAKDREMRPVLERLRQHLDAMLAPARAKR